MAAEVVDLRNVSNQEVELLLRPEGKSCGGCDGKDGTSHRKRWAEPQSYSSDGTRLGGSGRAPAAPRVTADYKGPSLLAAKFPEEGFAVTPKDFGTPGGKPVPIDFPLTEGEFGVYPGPRGGPDADDLHALPAGPSLRIVSPTGDLSREYLWYHSDPAPGQASSESIMITGEAISALVWHGLPGTTLEVFFDTDLTRHVYTSEWENALARTHGQVAPGSVYDRSVPGVDDALTWMNAYTGGPWYVRYDWPFGRLTPLTLQPRADLVALNPVLGSVAAPLIPTAIRYYDAGKCSVRIPWAFLGGAIAAEMDRKIISGVQSRDGDPACDASARGPWRITPVLDRTPGGTRMLGSTPAYGDKFEFLRTYTVRPCIGFAILNNAEVTVRFVGALRADHIVRSPFHVVPRLKFHLFDVQTHGVGTIFAWTLADQIRNELMTQLEPALNDVIESILAQDLGTLTCRFADDYEVDLQADLDCVDDLRIVLASAASPFPALPPGAANGLNTFCQRNPGEQVEVTSPAARVFGLQAFVTVPTRLGECKLIPTVHRVYQRTDGIDIVLSERAPLDPLTPALENMSSPFGSVSLISGSGMCGVPTPELPFARRFDFITG